MDLYHLGCLHLYLIIIWLSICMGQSITSFWNCLLSIMWNLKKIQRTLDLFLCSGRRQREAVKGVARIGKESQGLAHTCGNKYIYWPPKILTTSDIDHLSPQILTTSNIDHRKQRPPQISTTSDIDHLTLTTSNIDHHRYRPSQMFTTSNIDHLEYLLHQTLHCVETANLFAY